MDSDPDLESEAGVVRDQYAGGDVQQLQTQVGDLRGVSVSIPLREAGGHHVGVVDRLHLVDVVVPDASIESSVERVEEVEQLQGAAVTADDLEVGDLGEADGGGVEHLRGVLVLFEIVRHGGWQHLVSG